MINFDLIQAGIIIGSAPNSPEDVAKLMQLKVSAVICLQSDQDFRDRDVDWPTMQSLYQDSNLPTYRYPILDFDEIDLANKLVEPIRKLHNLLSAKQKVYIHCNAGICRAPAVVLGYLCHYEGMSIEGGLSQIRIARPVASPFRSAVKKALVVLSESD
jgi:protein-tyrosine phosphatase